MSTNDELMLLYDGYYTDGSVAAKREATSIQTFNHISQITAGKTYDRVLDIGAGEGGVLDKLSKARFGKTLSAVEISSSGIEAIRRRNIGNLTEVQSFDGYKIPHPDQSFDLGLAIHVVEHVEHERMFLREAARACNSLYVEVPLEHTRFLDRAIRVSGPHGHINFYTPGTFRNLLKTSGLEVERLMIFAHDLEFEQFMSGARKGWIKRQIRAGLLRFAPKTATRNLVYMAGALCSLPKTKTQ
jgi:SAM-dependent methyltransferase